MKSIFITTITGPDQPGLIKALAEKTRAIGGEWLITKVIKLDGHLAAIMRTTIDQDKEVLLKEELEKEFEQLSFDYAFAVTERQAPHKAITLEIDCLDRPGLTKDLSTILANLDIVLENMESTRHPLGAVSSTAYSTKVTLTVPLDTDSSIIAAEIEALSDQTQVKVIEG